MSRIITNNLRHNDASSDNLTLDGTGNITAPGNLSVTGTSTLTDDLNVDSGTLFVDASTDLVGIGTTSPGNFASNANKLVLNTGGNGGLTIATGSSNNGHIFFADGTTGDQAYRGIIKYEHGNDAMTFGTAGGTERLRITSDGTLQLRNSPGIDFSQIQTNNAGMTSETLDGYEEGTWDPIYNFSTSGDATCVSVGRYIKVGAVVYVQGYVYINSSNSLSGNVLIAGLPFASSSSPSQRTSAFVIGQARRFPEDHVYLRLLLEAGSTGIKMYNNDTSSNGNNRLTNANFTAAAEQNILAFSGSYTV